MAATINLKRLRAAFLRSIPYHRNDSNAGARLSTILVRRTADSDHRMRTNYSQLCALSSCVDQNRDPPQTFQKAAQFNGSKLFWQRNEK